MTNKSILASQPAPSSNATKADAATMLSMRADYNRQQGEARSLLMSQPSPARSDKDAERAKFEAKYPQAREYRDGDSYSVLMWAHRWTGWQDHAELAERAPSGESIDGPELRKLVNEYIHASEGVQGHAVPQWRSLVAFVDARRATAGNAAPDCGACAAGCEMNTTGDPQNDCGTCVLGTVGEVVAGTTVAPAKHSPDCENAGCTGCIDPHELAGQLADNASPRCPHCDDTGDVHRADGEWLGTCTCPAGNAAPDYPALRLFLNAAYPVASQINPRGYNWCEAYLDSARAAALAELAGNAAPTEADDSEGGASALRAEPAGQHEANSLPARRFENVQGFFDADYVEFAEGSKMGGGVVDGIPYDSLHYTRAEAEGFVAEGVWREVAVPQNVEQSEASGCRKARHTCNNGTPEFTATAAPGDLSTLLREYAGNSGYSHNDYADTMRQAADELDRLASNATTAAPGELTAHVCGVTPGIGQIELQLPGDVLDWCDIGCTVRLASNAGTAAPRDLNAPEFWKLCRKYSTAPEGEQRRAAEKAVLDFIASNAGAAPADAEKDGAQ